MIDITDLIAASYTPAAVDNYRDFVPTDAELQALEKMGRDVLLCFPPMPGACAVMSAMYAAGLRRTLPDAPIFVVAGTLSVNKSRVFGDDDLSRDWGALFSSSNASWDGHCWLSFGPYIADVSMFRTAYSKYSPLLLARHVRERFGEGRGMMICKAAATENDGFIYMPQYVLTEAQITALFAGALSLIKKD
jgi:hypothetical protein